MKFVLDQCHCFCFSLNMNKKQALFIDSSKVYTSSIYKYTPIKQFNLMYNLVLYFRGCFAWFAVHEE